MQTFHYDPENKANQSNISGVRKKLTQEILNKIFLLHPDHFLMTCSMELFIGIHSFLCLWWIFKSTNFCFLTKSTHFVIQHCIWKVPAQVTAVSKKSAIRAWGHLTLPVAPSPFSQKVLTATQTVTRTRQPVTRCPECWQSDNTWLESPCQHPDTLWPVVGPSCCQIF